MLKLYLNNAVRALKTLKFSGGEIQPKILNPSVRTWDEEEPFKAKLVAHLRSSDDIMELLMVTDAVRREYGEIDIDVLMPYVPYARQDRVCDRGEAMAVKVFCNLINHQYYKKVTIWDPHSDVTPGLLDRCRVVKQAELLMWAQTQLPQLNNVVLVSPDAGANKKTFEAAQLLGVKDVVRADKIRDTTNGAILETKVYSDHIGTKDFLIVDDICDGGRTFVELGKVLRPLTDGKIFLYVTHGIFSQGFAALLSCDERVKKHPAIDHIYTVNSFIPIESLWALFVTILNVSPS